MKLDGYPWFYYYELYIIAVTTQFSVPVSTEMTEYAIELHVFVNWFGPQSFIALLLSIERSSMFSMQFHHTSI